MPGNASRNFRRCFRSFIRVLRFLLYARELQLSRGVAFWDAMILGACLDAKVEILYTEDLPAASIASPRLTNPFV